MQGSTILSFSLALSLGVVCGAMPAMADGLGFSLQAKGGIKGGPGGGDPTPGSSSPTYYSWMSPEIQGAWDSGFLGQGTTMTFVDDFTSHTRYFGNLGDGLTRLRHGEWTSKEGQMIAPSANVVHDDFYAEQPVSLVQGSFNVLSLSYGFVDAASSYTSTWAGQYPQEQSIIAAAANGDAFVSKSAGNNSIAVGTAAGDGSLDYLGTGLIGTQSAIFVGALDFNGTTANPAPLASYSNFAGANADVQNHFLVVGVDSGTTGLAGTSFAAPIISGYAAVLSSKFTTATPTQVADQLLATARRDTVVNWNASVYGQGEASIANALAPDTIN